jgi:hypothetical protein
MPGEQPRVLRTSDGVAIEALARLPRAAGRAVVLCHPHPLYGGTMDNAIILSVARLLRERGGDEVGTLRFNFRGVPRSEGSHDQGRGELLDVSAAVDVVRRDLPESRVSLMGYSFGSWVALRAALEDPGIARLAMVAPAVRMLRYPESAAGRGLAMKIVVGDRDGFVGVDDARGLAQGLGAELQVIDGADHFFVGQRRAVAEAVVSWLLQDEPG